MSSNKKFDAKPNRKAVVTKEVEQKPVDATDAVEVPTPPSIIIPNIDYAVIQQKVDEAAQKGMLESINEFYTGWNSPFRKALAKDLEAKAIHVSFDLPDVLATLNERLVKEVDVIVNEAIGKTFLPLVSNFLIREDPQIKVSKILSEFITAVEFDHEEESTDDYYTELVNDDSSFKYIRISNSKITYEVHFHMKGAKFPNIGTCYTLPTILEKSSNFSGKYGVNYDNIMKTMKISLDGASLELPFTKGILEDPFITYIARLIMGKVEVDLSELYFSDDLFPERQCHC